MQEKTKTQADRKLIQSVLGIDPIDWARYPDGTLTLITPAGKKFKYSLKMIDVLKQDTADSKPAKKATTKKSKTNKSATVNLNAEVDAAVSHKVAPGAAAK